MKLNYKRTLLVGFAFFLIQVFWQAYDNIIPKILTDKFGLSQFLSGIIMAFDNILAVFMLPIFGALSDRHMGKRGRRTPFILIGTIAAAVLFVGMSAADEMQRSDITDIVSVTEPQSSAERDTALRTLYRFDGENNGDLSAVYGSEEMFIESMNEENPELSHLTKARQSYAWAKTLETPIPLVVFIALLLGVLIAMSIFRSPAVALMPDVTPKPLRSKGNAIINLMGTAGGVLVLILGILFGTGKPENILMNYTSFFGTVAFIMLAALLVFMLSVKEPQWAAEAQEAESRNTISADTSFASTEKLTKGEFRSLCFLLASVALWYMGYNAVTSKYSVYAGEVLGLDFNFTLIIAQAAAIVSYIPVGIVSSKIGRKKTILAGVILLGLSFGAAAFMKAGSNIWVMNTLFALAGIGWATINVNSYPMVVELAKAGNVGKFTGYYYTASMSAQIITPVLSGACLTWVGMRTLFPYAAGFVALAFATMLFVRHGDALPMKKKDLLENLDVDD
ncbi:MAG: SLC45 family MFS transporter [Ruminococcaceae bacterium]|nr:SLC45 family MFS transporter [Oscillospiraceae bacterium]